jgi:hypothetical protein
MFKSVPDKIVAKFEKRVGKLSQKVNLVSNKNNSSKEIWVCFVPEFIARLGYTRKKLLAKNINSEIYISSEKAVQPDPKETRKYLDKVLAEAIKKQKNNDSKISLNVLGISMGNVLAFRFANYFKINRLVSIVPGSKLPECIWESIATKKIALASNKDLKAYQKELAIYDPDANLDNLKAKKIEVYLGRYDLMIPYQRGLELVEKMKKKGLKPIVKTYTTSGHVETIINSLGKVFK